MSEYVGAAPQEDHAEVHCPGCAQDVGFWMAAISEEDADHILIHKADPDAARMECARCGEPLLEA